MSCVLEWHFTTTHPKVRKQRLQQKTDFEQKTDKYMKQRGGLINVVAKADKNMVMHIKVIRRCLCVERKTLWQFRSKKYFLNLNYVIIF